MNHEEMADHLEAVNYNLNVTNNVVSMSVQFLMVTKLYK